MMIWKVALYEYHAGILHAILLPSVAERERFAGLVVIAMGVVGGGRASVVGGRKYAARPWMSFR